MDYRLKEINFISFSSHSYRSMKTSINFKPRLAIVANFRTSLYIYNIV
jgi:hypothetical protein